MVLRLAVALDIPLRDRNGMLVAAGFAPVYPEHDLDDPTMRQVMVALGHLLERHAPYPAAPPASSPTCARQTQCRNRRMCCG
jgi:hypothetical protein